MSMVDNILVYGPLVDGMSHSHADMQSEVSSVLTEVGNEVGSEGSASNNEVGTDGDEVGIVGDTDGEGDIESDIEVGTGDDADGEGDIESDIEVGTGDDNEGGIEGGTLPTDLRVNRGGRPSGTSRSSRKPIILRKTHMEGYKKFKEFLMIFPLDIREAIYDQPIAHSGIHDMGDFAEDMSRGAVYVSPLICKGNECQYAHRCKLIENNVAPMGSPCPVEIYMIKQWYEEWIDTLMVDTRNKVERDQVATIIMCDLMLMRLRNKLSTSSTGNVVYTPVGVDRNGHVILKAEQAPEIAMEEKYMKLKARVQEELLATRESRAKLGMMDERDLAKSSSRSILRGAKILDGIIEAKSTAKELKGDPPTIGSSHKE